MIKLLVRTEGFDLCRHPFWAGVMQHVPRAVDDLKLALLDKSMQTHGLRLDIDDLITPACHDRDWHS